MRSTLPTSDGSSWGQTRWPTFTSSICIVPPSGAGLPRLVLLDSPVYNSQLPHSYQTSAPPKGSALDRYGIGMGPAMAGLDDPATGRFTRPWPDQMAGTSSSPPSQSPCGSGE